MFLFKKTPKPSVYRQKIKLSTFEGGLNLKKSENLMPISSAYCTYNFSHTDGALRGGLGITDFSTHFFKSADGFEVAKNAIFQLPSIEKTFHSKHFDQENNIRNDKLMFLSSEKKLYHMPLNVEEIDEDSMGIDLVPNLIFNDKPVALNYRLNGVDCTILSSPKDNMMVFGLTDNMIRVADAPHISSMAIHYERLFATVDGEQSSIWFSDDLDPTNWSVSLTEAGFIEMHDERGALKKVVSFNDYVFIFRDYGITRLSAFADQAAFSVAQLFVASGKIYPETVALCGDIVIFLASDGLYRFDGVNCTKILSNLDKGFENKDNSHAVAGYFENKYYLSCGFEFFDKTIDEEANILNNCLIEIDLNTMQTIFLRGAEIIDINTVLTDSFNGVIVCAKELGGEKFKMGVIDHSGKIFGENSSKVWLSPLTDLGYPARKKCIRALTVNADSACMVKLKNEKGERVFKQIAGSSAPTIIPLRFFGTKFSFEFDCGCADCVISNPNITIVMNEGV